MGIVAVPSSASRSAFGACGLAVRRSPPLRRPFVVLAFKGGPGSNCSEAVVSPPVKETKKSPGKRAERGKAAVDSCTRDPGYDELAAALENIYKLSPEDFTEWEAKGVGNAVRNKKKKAKRLGLEERVSLRQQKKEEEESVEEANSGRKTKRRDLNEDEEKLVREYSISTDLNRLDWKRVKIPPVLGSVEHTWLFKSMQPMKAILQVKEELSEDLKRESTYGELADAVNTSVPLLRRHLEVGQAARNKLIKHNLRLVLFVINKYYPEIATGHRFQEFCQAGARGLITAIDRFEPRRGFRLSTYGLFWIRHSISRSMTLASFTKVPFGIESVRQEIQKGKLELSFELGRLPTEKETADRVRISLERYNDVVKTSRPVFSLHAKHIVTQEEFINGITDIDGSVGGDKHRQPALLRLALDDVLDSLKPKESLVLRQRYGLDGKGERTLGEIAGNLNISREMVRKHELKALLKLKHPTRVDYLRRYI